MTFNESTQEVEKIDNMLSTFGWKIAKQEITEDEIILTIKKTKDSSLTEISPGAS